MRGNRLVTIIPNEGRIQMGVFQKVFRTVVRSVAGAEIRRNVVSIVAMIALAAIMFFTGGC